MVESTSGGRTQAAKVLIGWMAPDLARRMIVSNRGDVEPTAEQLAQIEHARQEVAARSAAPEPEHVVVELPDALAEHVARLRTEAAEMFDHGWDVGLVDLAQLRAFQPSVFVDSARARVRGISPDNLVELLMTTLPTDADPALEPQFDESQMAWTLTSPNPNLSVVGHVGGPSPEGVPLFGFFVAVRPSYLQVARFGDRYILRDGYHRAVGLLSAGISRVPAFVRDFESIEEVTAAGMLPQDAYLGDRPPFLGDYMDAAVAAEVLLPRYRKLILVQALELTLMGE